MTQDVTSGSRRRENGRVVTETTRKSGREAGWAGGRKHGEEVRRKHSPRTLPTDRFVLPRCDVRWECALGPRRACAACTEITPVFVEAPPFTSVIPSILGIFLVPGGHQYVEPNDLSWATCRVKRTSSQRLEGCLPFEDLQLSFGSLFEFLMF